MQAPKQEEPVTPAGIDEDVFWKLVLQNWRRAVALDLHHHYGLDVSQPGFYDRPFWFVRERILGLLDDADTRLWHIVRQAREDVQGASGASA